MCGACHRRTYCIDSDPFSSQLVYSTDIRSVYWQWKGGIRGPQVIRRTSAASTARAYWKSAARRAEVIKTSKQTSAMACNRKCYMSPIQVTEKPTGKKRVISLCAIKSIRRGGHWHRKTRRAAIERGGQRTTYVKDVVQTRKSMSTRPVARTNLGCLVY